MSRPTLRARASKLTVARWTVLLSAGAAAALAVTVGLPVAHGTFTDATRARAQARAVRAEVATLDAKHADARSRALAAAIPTAGPDAVVAGLTDAAAAAHAQWVSAHVDPPTTRTMPGPDSHDLLVYRVTVTVRATPAQLTEFLRGATRGPRLVAPAGVELPATGPATVTFDVYTHPGGSR